MTCGRWEEVSSIIWRDWVRLETHLAKLVDKRRKAGMTPFASVRKDAGDFGQRLSCAYAAIVVVLKVVLVVTL